MRVQRGKGSLGNAKRVEQRVVASPTMGDVRNPVFKRPAKKQVA